MQKAGVRAASALLGALLLSTSPLSGTSGAVELPPMFSSTPTSPPTPAVAVASRPADAVVLVTLDGVRWQDVFDTPQLWPNAYRLLHERGVALGGGAVPISASGPDFMSLPGYTEILVGHSPPACANNECGATRVPTIVDDVLDRGEGASVIASWERLERAVAKAPRHAVVTTGRHGGTSLPRDGFAKQVGGYRNVRPEPGGGDYRPDRFTTELGLRELRERRPTFLMIGLGDPDEYAHANDRPGYLRSLRACDTFLGDLFRTLDDMGERGARTTVIVTADHGRCRDFQGHGGFCGESSRVWLLAFGAGIEARGVVQLHEARHLADIAPTLRVLLGLPEDHHPHAGHFLEEIRAPRVAMLP